MWTDPFDNYLYDSIVKAESASHAALEKGDKKKALEMSKKADTIRQIRAKYIEMR